MAQDAVADEAESLLAIESHEEQFLEGGAFLPLGAWAVQGMDVDRIKSLSHPSDIKEHAVLGTTFRVRILTKTHATTRGFKRKSGVTKKQAPKSLPISRQAIEDGDNEASDDAREPLAIEDKQSSSDSSSSSSDSSSSSSSDAKGKKKKKKNHKKTDKKHKKAAKKGSKDKKKSKKDAKTSKKDKKEDTICEFELL